MSLRAQIPERVKVRLKRYKDGAFGVYKRNKNNRWYCLRRFYEEKPALDLLVLELVKCGTINV